MYNFNELLNLALNSMEFEGLKYDSLLMFFLDLGVTISVADELINEIDVELALAA